MCVVVTGEADRAVLRVEMSGIANAFAVERAGRGCEPATGEPVVDHGIIRIHVPAGPARSALHTDWFRV